MNDFIISKSYNCCFEILHIYVLDKRNKAPVGNVVHDTMPEVRSIWGPIQYKDDILPV